MARMVGDCPECGAKDQIVFNAEESLRYARCESCTTVFLFEQLSELGLRLDREDDEDELRGQRLRELIA
ncbi:hypothetical protein HYZ80_00220 [Candidatus Parcubacteria bacterium]|nr:hypothetical protein [Candidatus Parcubacteria bacterium]